MPRSLWSGSISFGMVTIPIKMYTAVSRKNVRFNQIDLRTTSRVRQKRVSEADGSEVPADQIGKGYQLPGGEFVILTEDEVKSVAPESSRTMEIVEFVDLADIDPIYYDSAYLIAPDKATVKPYALLAKAMEDSGKVALARFVMHTKQHFAAIRPVDGRLLLSTLIYDDELNDPAEIPELDAVSDVEIVDKELGMAKQLIDSLEGEFTPEEYEDEHRQRVLDMIEAKASGATGLAGGEEPEESKAEVIDLMAALEASVAAAKKSRERHPTGRDEADEDVAEEAEAPKPARKAAAKKAPAKKAAAKKAPAKKVAAKARKSA